eukprot:TRINITY_DN45974_c0_g1_i1.p1 TRINITY_DN45974_c0_g1~~TRINITY_DN45974_c0_g1_i1.p1  ORF type:complete len:727 (-),score=53.95 TRINITY_DN45974_c0_g1_i1:203-2320(-)
MAVSREAAMSNRSMCSPEEDGALSIDSIMLETGEEDLSHVSHLSDHGDAGASSLTDFVVDTPSSPSQLVVDIPQDDRLVKQRDGLDARGTLASRCRIALRRAFFLCVALFVFGAAVVSASVSLGFLSWCDLGLKDDVACAPIPVVQHTDDDSSYPDYILSIDKTASSEAIQELKDALDLRGVPHEHIELIDGFIVQLSPADLAWITADPPPIEIVQGLERNGRVWEIEPLIDADDAEESANVTNSTSFEESPPRRLFFWGRRRSSRSAPPTRRRWTKFPVFKSVAATVRELWSSTPWHLDVLDTKSGAKREDGSYRPVNTAPSVDIYILDTGVRTSHVEFAGRVASEHWELDRGAVGATQDVQGHGTAMAGAALGRGSGSAKGARLVSVQALRKDGQGSWADILAGLNWIATRKCEKCVVSMSLGGGFSIALNNAVQNLISRGYPVVVAAGNAGADACSYSPASVAEALTVGALDRSGAVSSFSNTGPCVDIFAPGEQIRTASRTNFWGSLADNGIAEISGTSPATAVAAGVAAMYLQEGVPKSSLKDSMVAGASKWGAHSFVSAFPRRVDVSPPETVAPASWKESRGETSTRRRYYTFHRRVTVDGIGEGTAGDVLHCKLRSGRCLYGSCDADLVAKGYYRTVHRRRRRDYAWQALAWSRSSTLNEDVQVTLSKSGPIACEAMPVAGHAQVVLEAGLAKGSGSR